MLTVVILLITALVGYAIGNPKGRPIAGLVLGGTLGLIGCVIVAVLPRKR